MYKIVKKSEYELLKKMAYRQEKYIEQIKINNRTISDNNKLFEELSFMLLKLAGDKRKLASRIGGLTKSLNCKKREVEQLSDKVDSLKDSLKESKEKVSFYKKYGGKNMIEKMKNYIEIRKECEKRSKNEK